MGHESVVYGAILVPRWKREDFERLQRLNGEVIASLPEEEDWPFLTRTMFTVGGTTIEGGRYKSQVIHFGATFKEIEGSWDDWLEKFEQLLRRLFWHEVYLHLRTEKVGHYNYTYRAQGWPELAYKREPPQPPNRWSFTGGPRHFETERSHRPKYNWMPTAEEVRTWAYDEDAWLVDQDEDLVFLAPKYVPLLVELIADDQCPKRAVALRYLRHTTKHLLERGARGDKSGLATLKTTAYQSEVAVSPWRRTAKDSRSKSTATIQVVRFILHIIVRSAPFPTARGWRVTLDKSPHPAIIEPWRLQLASLHYGL